MKRKASSAESAAWIPITSILPAEFVSQTCTCASQLGDIRPSKRYRGKSPPASVWRLYRSVHSNSCMHTCVHAKISLPSKEKKSDYSRLDHLSPTATAVMDGLKKKGADIKWLCQSICGSAVAEGSQYFGTRWLSTVGSEKTFHRRLASSLPRTEMIKLPV